MIKYVCDDCGAELGEYDNIAGQLDMTNHTYCHKCLQEHADLYKSTSWPLPRYEKKVLPDEKKSVII